MDSEIKERGITVGKSWPRPTTACNLVPRWEGEFASHADWVNFASKRLTVAADSNGYDLTAMCVDTLGRRCANGRDFKRADDEGTFPVRYFWDCQPAADINEDLLEACKKLDTFWLADWEPPHDDPEQQEPRILTKETMDVWRDIRAAIARATGAQS